MKTTLFILSTLLLLASCSDPIYYTLSNGNTIRLRKFTTGKDHHNKRNKTTLQIVPFDAKDINKKYDNYDSIVIQEITTSDLKSAFTDYDFILVNLWNACSITYKYELYQFRDLVDTLEQLKLDSRVAFVFASISYNYSLIDYILRGYKYNFQSYLIPYKSYGDIVFLKRIKFLKELNPEGFKKLNDEASEYSLLLLNGKGELVKAIDFEHRGDPEVKEFKDYDKTVAEIVALLKGS